jgi:hypothetical protein
MLGKMGKAVFAFFQPLVVPTICEPSADNGLRIKLTLDTQRRTSSSPWCFPTFHRLLPSSLTWHWSCLKSCLRAYSSSGPAPISWCAIPDGKNRRYPQKTGLVALERALENVEQCYIVGQSDLGLSIRQHRCRVQEMSALHCTTIYL